MESDHQPLQILVKKPLKNVPRRLQRMLLELQRNDYNLTYKKGELLFIADTLSRAYVEDKAFEYDATERVYRLTSEKEWKRINLAQETSGLSDERIRQIREHTCRDTNWQELQATIKTGWPMKAAEVKTCLRPYFHIRDELVVENDVIYRGARCITPPDIRKDILQLEKLHSVHMGITGTARQARESVYWPNMNADIKNYIERCEICSENRTTAQQRKTLIPHERSSQPWAKFGIDMFSLDKRNFLITVDYWSNFFELDQILGETTSVKIIQCLSSFLGSFLGMVSVSFLGMVSPIQLSLTMVPSFLLTHSHSKWMFRHITTSPYQAQSNGMVESSEKIAKNIFRTSLAANEDPWLAILSFKNTPTTGMSTSPVQRLMSRRTKTLLPLTKDLLLPDPEGTHTSIKERELKQSRQEERYKKRAKDLPALKEGDDI